MKSLTLLGCLAFLLLPGCTGQQPKEGEAEQPTVAVPMELGAVLRDYEKAWSNRDATGLAHLFTEDGFVLSPQHQMVRGRTAIERFYTGTGGPLFLRAVAFATEGNVGYIIGAYSSASGAPDEGKFTLTLRRQPSGAWLIFSDMDNGNGGQRH